MDVQVPVLPLSPRDYPDLAKGLWLRNIPSLRTPRGAACEPTSRQRRGPRSIYPARKMRVHVHDCCCSS